MHWRLVFIIGALTLTRAFVSTLRADDTKQALTSDGAEIARAAEIAPSGSGTSLGLLAQAGANEADPKPAIEPEPAKPEPVPPPPPPARADQGADEEVAPRNEARKNRLNVIVQLGKPVHVLTNEIAENVVVIFDNATIDGDVDENVVVIGGTATIRGKVGENAVCVLGNLDLESSAVIRGDAVGIGGGVQKKAGARVRGETVSIPFPGAREFSVHFPQWLSLTAKELVLKGRPLSLRVAWVWWVYGAVALALLLLSLILPKAVRAGATVLETQPAVSLLVGLLALPLALCIALLLAVTGVGILLWPVLFAAVVFAAFLGKASVLQHLGSTIGRQFNVDALRSPLAAFFLGLAILTLLYLVWYLGIVTWMVATAWGLGAALVALFGQFQREMPEPPFPPSPVPGAVSRSVPLTTLSAVAPRPPDSFSSSGSSMSSGSESTSASGGNPPDVGANPAGPPPGPVPSLAPGVIMAPEALTLPRAGFWRRLGAAFIDIVLLGVVTGWLLPMGLILWVAYFAAMWAWKGTTVGGIVFGLKVVRQDGRMMDPATALVRSVATILSVGLCFLGYIWAAWDPQKQTWHDKIAGTVLVVAPSSQSLI